MLLAKSRKQRSEKHQIFCEGYLFKIIQKHFIENTISRIRLIKDAIDADFKLNYLLCNNIDNLDPLIGAHFYNINANVFNLILNC